MIYLKTPADIQAMAPACDLISRLMGQMAEMIQPGVTTHRLDTVAREYIRDNGGKPECLGFQGFPATLCIEVNDTVVHGFPGPYTLQEGDIIGIDTVVRKDDWCADMCYTFPVGEISPEVMELLRTTRQSLDLGIEAAQPGRRIGDIANAIQSFCEHRRYGIVREMCGHGIGRSMHEDPEVPNYGRRGTGPILRPGMVICIEPMVNLGSRNIVIDRDGWQCRTRDRRPSAHYEHTVYISPEGPQRLTTYQYIQEAMGERFI